MDTNLYRQVEMYCAIPLTNVIHIEHASGQYCVSVSEWNGVEARGNTASKALVQLEITKRAYVHDLLNKGLKPAVPQTRMANAAMDAFVAGWQAAQACGNSKVKEVPASVPASARFEEEAAAPVHETEVPPVESQPATETAKERRARLQRERRKNNSKKQPPAEEAAAPAVDPNDTEPEGNEAGV